MRHIIKRQPARFLLLAVCLLTPAYLSAQTFSGKCVGVTDGDTIKVLRSGIETKIRLEGIDCPESGDAFSAKANKFTSSLVFGKTVTVRVKETEPLRPARRPRLCRWPRCLRRTRPSRPRLALHEILLRPGTRASREDCPRCRNWHLVPSESNATLGAKSPKKPSSLIAIRGLYLGGVRHGLSRQPE